MSRGSLMSDLAHILESAAASAGFVSAGALAYAVRVPSCSWLAPSVSRGTDTRPAIALTFDDGPSESTVELLEMPMIGRDAQRAMQIERILASVRLDRHAAVDPLEPRVSRLRADALPMMNAHDGRGETHLPNPPPIPKRRHL